MRIKNWTQFQHFKNRDPIWIKLYRNLLDDIEWHQLDPLAAKTLVSLWLLASEDSGKIPEIKVLAFRLRIPEKDVIKAISQLDHWIEKDDSNLISTCYQGDILEKRREDKNSDIKPTDVSEETWTDYLTLRKSKKAPVTASVLKGLRKDAEQIGWTLEQVLAIQIKNGWQGFNPEWIASKKENTPAAGLQSVFRGAL
jgi:hypothetical protein